MFWKSWKWIGAGADMKWIDRFGIDVIIITITIADQRSLPEEIHNCISLNQRLYYDNIPSSDAACKGKIPSRTKLIGCPCERAYLMRPMSPPSAAEWRPR